MMRAIILFLLATSSILATYETGEHKIKFQGKSLEYTATAGTLPVVDKENKEKGDIFFVYYAKKSKEPAKRGIAFCFNGGPGSSSVWLHLGILGPKHVQLSSDGTVAPPYGYEENPYTLLNEVDLVFIDPISTGYSLPSVGEDAKQFHGIKEDIDSLAKFIRLFLTEFQRWEDPKFLVGESYGTTRACALALHMHDQDYIYLNGLVLISSALEFQTFCETQESHDLPYMLSLPSFAATAWFYGKAGKGKTQSAHRKEAEFFCMNEYGPALLRGHTLPDPEKKELAKKMAALIGIDPSVIEEKNLRICSTLFRKKLLKDTQEIIGRFDGRVRGPTISSEAAYDPSFEAVLGVFTGAINSYLEKDLGVTKKEPYEVLSQLNWNFGDAAYGFPGVAKDLSEVMVKNPNLKVFIASGFYDLATPYFATRYVINHLPGPASLQKRILFRDYEGGHMMYSEQKESEKLYNDLKEFFSSK